MKYRPQVSHCVGIGYSICMQILGLKWLRITYTGPNAADGMRHDIIALDPFQYRNKQDYSK